MGTERTNSRFYFAASESLLSNFWLGLLLLLALGKALYSRRILFKINPPKTGDTLLRVMATAELLRSHSSTDHISNGTTPHDGPLEPTQSFDSSIFRSYLLSLLPPVLGASLDELEPIFDDEFEERVSRFAAEGGGVIYVVKVKDEAEGMLAYSFVSA